MSLICNYKYSKHPKRGDRVCIIAGYDAQDVINRTGTVILGKKGMGYTYFVDIVGIGVRRFHIKSLYNLAL